MASKHGIQAAFELDGEVYSILRCVVEERVDEVPRLVARITRDDVLPKPVSVLGVEAKFRLGAVDLFDAPRLFNGLVTAAERRIDVQGRPYLEVVVEPSPYKLKLRTNCRTFLDQKVDDILKKVLDDAGVEHELRLGESYSPRPNVIQYRESDFDFLRRIAAEEGIAFSYDHEKAVLVLFDDPQGLGEAADSTMPYIPEFGFDQPFACVHKVRREQRVTTDKVKVRQYDFERPRALVESDTESKDDGAHALEAYLHPVRTVDAGTAKRFAQVALDAIQARRDLVTGSTSSWLMAPATRFTIEQHPFEALNQELFVTAIRLVHEDVRTATGEASMRTDLTFDGIPTAKSTYRPERRPRARAIPGLQIATTTGASGQEIDVDKHGRVTAIYPWDRYAKEDDTASTRMRTLQMPTGGSMLLPRVGWEVLVQCDEGDPDTPLVVGRLYNGITMPPYSLPGGAVRSSLQTATSPGGGSTNELRTDDSKGSEEMFFNASKDMTVEVKNNTTEFIGNNATMQVGGNQTLDITNSLTTFVGANQTLDVGGNQKVSVETFKVDQVANHTYSIGGNRDMKVGGDHKHTVGGAETVDIGSLKTDLVVGKISETAGGNISLDVGAATVTLTAGDCAIEAGGNHTETITAVKIVLTFGGLTSETTGTSMTQVGGAKIHLVDADRAETAGATYTSLAAGANIVKADNITFEADSMITLVMGASILSLTPASVAFLGASVKLDGATSETAALVVDN